MFYQIINEIGNIKNWIHSGNEFSVDVSQYYQEDIDLILDFLKINGLNPSLDTFTTKEENYCNIILSQKDFNTFHNGINAYKNQKNLLENGELYDPLSEEELNIIKDHITLKFDEQSDANKDQKRKDEFFEVIQKQAPYSCLANRNLNEFLFLLQEKDQTNFPIHLTIDLSNETLPVLEKEQANGLATRRNNQPFMMMKPLTDKNISFSSNTFFHELRHIIQMTYGLISSKRQSNSDVSYILDTLTGEAEAKAYELIICSQKKDFISSIVEQTIQKKALDTVKNPSLVPYSHNLSKEEKIGATLRYIQIEAYENVLDLICQIYLQSSRIKIYNFLNKNNIHLSSFLFKKLAEHVEYWRNYYYPRTIYYAPKSEENSNTDINIIKELEERWLNKTGLHLSLSPSHIFSKDIAESFSISPSIYPERENLPPLFQAVYNVNHQMVQQITDLYNQGKFDEILHLYQEIQQKNPFLPNKIQARDIQSAVRYCSVAIDNMHRGASFQTVLSKFGYQLNDPKPISQWIPPTKDNQQEKERQ
ncbi:MAG: hypothetical protein J6V53_07415 [Alphaproteobacteria bacterium]|nr:hypothetical protein [Alphaproteobacteria bacterium]